MLPTEVFADAVAFLRLFDLSALAVANSLCSTLATKASASIRWEVFPGFRFDIDDERLVVTNTKNADEKRVASLTFPNESAMAEFLDAALPNCIFEDVYMIFQSKHVLDATGRLADSFIVAGTLLLAGHIGRNDVLELGRKFRKVKALLLSRIVGDNDANEIDNFYRGSGIEELQYYRYCGETTIEKAKIALI